MNPPENRLNRYVKLARNVIYSFKGHFTIAYSHIDCCAEGITGKQQVAREARCEFFFPFSGNNCRPGHRMKYWPCQQMKQLMCQIVIAPPSYIPGVQQYRSSKNIGHDRCGRSSWLKIQVKDLDSAGFLQNRKKTLRGPVAKLQFRTNSFRQFFRISIAIARLITSARRNGQTKRCPLFAPYLQVVILLTEAKELRFNYLRLMRRPLSPQHTILDRHRAFTKEKCDRTPVRFSHRSPC